MARSSAARVLFVCAMLLLAVQLAIVPGLAPANWLEKWGLATQAQASLSFQPSNVSLAVGADTWITVRINNVSNLYAVDVRLSFDPTVIQVLDASAAAGINIEPGSFPLPEIIVKNEVNNSVGDIWYVVSQQSPTPPVNGSGTLARIHIRGLANGTTTIRFVGHSFATPDGIRIPTTAGTCLVQVGTGGGTATPTASPTQTGTPTEGPSPTPSLTPSITNTPTPSPTPARRTFTGKVYEGNVGDRRKPLAGVRVQLWGSWNPGQHGFHINSAVTNFQGEFSVSFTASYPHYSLIEEDPAGYISAGVIPGTGGVRINENWVQFLNTVEGTYAGTEFFDLPGTGATATPTATPGGGEVTPTPTSGVPTPDGGPIYVSVRAEKDTFLDKANPDRNYGKEGHLHFGFDRDGVTKDALVWFDLSDIPPGAAIREASFFLFGRYVDSTIPLCVQILRQDWEELEATWRQAKEQVPWSQNGALDIENDIFAESTEGLFQLGGGAQFYEWDVRAAVQQWVDGDRENYGFFVRICPGSRAKAVHGLYSGDYKEAALHPMLSIVYTGPTPMPTAIFTNTPTPTETQTPTPTATATPGSGAGLWLPCILENHSGAK